MKNTMTQRGFTLIETMVAISILVVAVTGPLTLASQSLFAAVYAKDQTTAFYLAQEAVEMVRNKRDSNMLEFLNGQQTDWLNGIPVDTSFAVDIPHDTIVECGIDCLKTKLKHDGTFYNLTTGPDSRFARSVLVTKNQNLADEAVVTVTVEWQTGSFNKRTITVGERLFNWVPIGNVAEVVGVVPVVPVAPTQCADGIDNDGDLLTDLADPGCTDAGDVLEFDIDIGDIGIGPISVICTELHRQGLLADDLYAADSAFGATLSQTTIDGYHIWAGPVVLLMQHSKIATSIVSGIAHPWINEMAYQMGAQESGSNIGKLMMWIGIPVSWTIGAVVHVVSAGVGAVVIAVQEVLPK